MTFDANGGTGTMDGQTADAGATVKLAASAFERDGYAFAGWNTAKDGSGTAYADGAEVEVEGDMTLYAQWTEATSSTATSGSKSSTAKSSSASSNIVKTGDDMTMMAVTLAVIAIAASAIFLARRKME